MTRVESRKLAVLIDAENIAANHADAIFDEIARYGEATVRRVYRNSLVGATKGWAKKFGPPATAETSGSGESQKPLNHARQLTTNVLPDTHDPDGWGSLSWLAKRLLQRYPDFDPRSYGHARLRDLVQAIGKFEISEAPELRIRLRP